MIVGVREAFDGCALHNVIHWLVCRCGGNEWVLVRATGLICEFIRAFQELVDVFVWTVRTTHCPLLIGVCGHCCATVKGAGDDTTKGSILTAEQSENTKHVRQDS